MNYEAYVNVDRITDTDGFNSVVNDIDEKLGFYFEKWSVYKLGKYALSDAAVHLADYIAENSEDEDFEDGKLKPTSFHPDAKFSEFLSTIFTVVRKPKEFEVQVTFRLEAESESDAQHIVEDAINYRIGLEYAVDDVNEQ